MKNKKGIELAVGMFVKIILAVVVFTFGIYIAYQIFGQTSALSDQTVEKTTREIGQLACPGGEKLCLSSKQLTIGRGEVGKLGATIENFGADESFTIAISLKSASDSAGKDMAESDAIIFIPKSYVTDISPNDKQTIGIAVSPKDTAQSGTYALEVKVTNAGVAYGSTRFYVTVP